MTGATDRGRSNCMGLAAACLEAAKAESASLSAISFLGGGKGFGDVGLFGSKSNLLPLWWSSENWLRLGNRSDISSEAAAGLAVPLGFESRAANGSPSVTRFAGVFVAAAGAGDAVGRPRRIGVISGSFSLFSAGADTETPTTGFGASRWCLGGGADEERPEYIYLD